MTRASENLGTWMLQNAVHYGHLLQEEIDDRLESFEMVALATTLACHMVGQHLHGLLSSLLDLVPLIGRKTENSQLGLTRNGTWVGTAHNIFG